MTIDRQELRRLYKHSLCIPALLDELDAKDRRIAELEAAGQSVRSGAAEAVAAHDAQVARIAELEAIVSSTDDLVRQLRNALAAALEIGRASEGNDLKWRTLTKHASKLLPSEET